MKRFPIGFWNYTDIAKHRINHDPAACVKDWADAGMTFAMGPNYSSSPEDVGRMRALLDAAAASDIRVILSHKDGYWPALTKNGEERYRRDFARAVTDLGSHPVVSGFHAGDEPGHAEFADACRAMRIQKELAPGLSPFLNLLPMYRGIDSRIGYSDWARYLDDYAAAAHPPLLCYDCYAQMNPDPEDEGNYWGYPMYFENLRTYWEAGRRNRLDYWTTLLSVGHFRYRCPTEDDLRWQLNTAVASGAKGILWFFFYMREPHDNYRVAPIDEHWERTGTFGWLSRVCRTFLKWHAPVLLESELLAAWHVGKAWGGWPAFDGSGLVKAAESQHGVPLIVSHFRHAGGADYVAVVNNSQNRNTRATLVVRGDRPNLHRVGWEGAETALVDSCGNGAERGADYIKVGWWLAPGQMELFRVG